MSFSVAGCEVEISLTPNTDLFASVNSDENFTITCAVSKPTALWVINNGQISSSQVPQFEAIGVFIVLENDTEINITFTNRGRDALQVQDSLYLQCAVLLTGPPRINFGPKISVSTYGK